MDYVIPYAIVFGAVFVLDFVWAFYTKAIQNHAALRAASWAALLILLSGAAQIGYTHEPLLLIPAMFGAFGGTYTALRFTKSESST